MILLYKVLSSFLYPFLVLMIYLRRFLGKEDLTRFKEKIFPSSFNIINKKTLIKSTRGKKVKKKGFKKAIITLKKGQNIDLTTGI